MYLPTIISRLFDPLVVMSVATLVAISKSGLPVADVSVLAIEFFLLMLGVPVIILSWAVRTGRVTNWDISRRSERPKALFLLLLLGLINLLVVSFFKNPQLTWLFALYEIWLLGFSGITLFWKISGHTGTTSLAVGLLLSTLGLQWWPIILAIPLVGWARIIRRDHTIAQVVCGVLYSVTILFIFYLGK